LNVVEVKRFAHGASYRELRNVLIGAFLPMIPRFETRRRTRVEAFRFLGARTTRPVVRFAFQQTPFA
jgi:hypothetical protein